MASKNQIIEVAVCKSYELKPTIRLLLTVSDPAELREENLSIWSPKDLENKRNVLHRSRQPSKFQVTEVVTIAFSKQGSGEARAFIPLILQRMS